MKRCEVTWDRSGDVNRVDFQKNILQDLVLRQIPCDTLIGTLAERMAQVEKTLDREFNEVL